MFILLCGEKKTIPFLSVFRKEKVNIICSTVWSVNELLALKKVTFWSSGNLTIQGHCRPHLVQDGKDGIPPLVVFQAPRNSLVSPQLAEWIGSDLIFEMRPLSCCSIVWFCNSSFHPKTVPSFFRCLLCSCRTTEPFKMSTRVRLFKKRNWELIFKSLAAFSLRYAVIRWGVGCIGLDTPSTFLEEIIDDFTGYNFIPLF